MMFRQLRLMRHMYDHLRALTLNGENNHDVRLLLRKYEQSEFYREPNEINKGVTNAEPRNNA